ncbi:MAG: hypothetical protein Tsb0033_04610 [Winogradskyella sp.]
MVLLSNALSCEVIVLSKESTAAKTAIIEKIPTVTPNSDKKVLNLLFLKAFIANEKLSLRRRKYNSIKYFYTMPKDKRF